MRATDLPKLSFITWYSEDIQSAAAFFAQFGIVFVKERHGCCPVHFALQDDSLAIELYPANERDKPSGAGTLIGFQVADADEAGSISDRNGIDIIERVKTTAMGRRVIVSDPDGRHVFLFSPALEAQEA